MPNTTVAAIIKNDEDKILLTRRNVEPFKDQWCFLVGILIKMKTFKMRLFEK